MSTILQFTERHNIPLTKDQKEKIISMEVMLNLSDNDIKIVELAKNPIFVIRTKYYDYYIFKIKDGLKINIRGDTTNEYITKNNFVSTIEFCISHAQKGEVS